MRDEDAVERAPMRAGTNGAGKLAILLAALLSLAAVSAQRTFLEASSPFGWDEAEHAWHGATIAADLRRLDLPLLWEDTMRQAFWPPGQSWFLAPVLAVTGPSSTAARAAGLPLVILAVVLCAWITGILAPRERSLAALAAAILALGSRNLLLYGRTVYAEPLLLVLVLASTALWIRAALHGTALPFLLAGLAAAATFLVKYPYGLLLLAVGLSASIALAAGDRRTAGRSLLFFGLPAACLDVLWFLLPVPAGTPDHTAQFAAFFTHNLSVEDFHPVTYYLDSIQKSYAPSLPIAILSGGSLLVFAAGAIRRLARRGEQARRPSRHTAIDASIVFVALELVAFLATASLAGAKQERVLLPWAAPLWIAGGMACAGIVSGCFHSARRRAGRVRRGAGLPAAPTTVEIPGEGPVGMRPAKTRLAGSWPSIPRSAALASLLGILGYLVPLRLGGTIPGPEGWQPHRISVPSPRENLAYLYGFHDVPSACYSRAGPILDFVAAHAPPRGFTLWLGGFDEFSPFLLRWEILRRLPRGPQRDAFLHHEAVTIVERDPFPAAATIEPGSEEERIFFGRASGFDAVFTLDPPDPKQRSLRGHLEKYREAFSRHPGFLPAGHAAAVLAVREGHEVTTTVTLFLPRGGTEREDRDS